MAKNARWDAAHAASIVAMEMLDFSKPPKVRQRTLFEIILFAIDAAERDRETRADRLLHRRLVPSSN